MKSIKLIQMFQESSRLDYAKAQQYKMRGNKKLFHYYNNLGKINERLAKQYSK